MQPASGFSTGGCRLHRSHLYEERKGGPAPASRIESGMNRASDGDPRNMLLVQYLEFLVAFERAAGGGDGDKACGRAARNGDFDFSV
jgi:hypothetical protein